jgi:pimeloyl-ACP methyl ester carboxylesterase
MAYILAALAWFFAILFGLLTVSMLLMNNWLSASVLLIVVLLFLPPVTGFVQERFDFKLHPILRGLLIVGFLFVFVKLLTGGEVTSIYGSPEAKAKLLEIYDEKMTEWPVPYEDIFVETEYGKVHVIASGPADAPPMLLLHASSVAGWSWKHNVEGLSKEYRTYAIDLIGDAGKSEFTDLKHTMKNGKDQADLYKEIADKLGADKAYVVGASEGGFIGTNYAIHYPERVKKIVLAGPMGYSGVTQSVIRIMFTTFFPLKPIQESTFRWAFSDSEKLTNEFGKWFRLYMTAFNPNFKVRPTMFSAKERKSLKMPVMFVFGERDNLVGDTKAASELVQDVPDVRVEIVNAGHLMAAEQPGEVNGLITDFFKESAE